MFVTSSSYKETMISGFIDNDLKGTITLTDGTVIEITEKDIIPESFGFDNKAVNGNDFGFGGIYVGELCMTIKKDINRYSLYGAELKFSYFQNCIDGTVQEIPLGLFYVYDAIRTKKLIQLKAYDKMTSFDKKVEETTTGFVVDILHFICDKCEMELGQTDEEISAFTNSEWWLTLDAEHISTYREALSQLATICGRFCTINRYGKLILVPFGATSQETISARRRTDSKIQDFSTIFRSIKARFLANQNYYPYTETDESGMKGLELDLGDISIFQGEDYSKHDILQNLLGLLVNMVYVPTEFSMLSDPSIELGDCLTLENVNNSTESVVTQVHSLSWKYHSTMKVTCYGSDPMLDGVVSKDNTIIKQLETSIASKDMVVKSFTNSKKLTISGSSEIEIISMNFATTKETTVLFMTTIPFEASLDGVLSIKYYLDGVEASGVKQYVDRGNHVITLMEYFPMSADGRSTLSVTGISEPFESDVRKQNAKILSFKDWIDHQTVTTVTTTTSTITNAETGEVTSTSKSESVFGYEYKEHPVDTTIASFGIEKSTVRAVLFAQGLAGQGQWDGTINMTEDMKPVKFILNMFKVGQMNDSVVVQKQTPEKVNLNERLKTTFAGGIEYKLAPMTEALNTERITMPVTEVRDSMQGVKMNLMFNVSQTMYVDFNENQYVKSDNGVLKLNDKYTYFGSEVSIDEGKLLTVQIKTDDKQSVESVVIGHD